MTQIILEVGPLRLAAQLNDTATARQIVAQLPISGQVNVWGQEFYFAIPVDQTEAPDATEVVPLGALAYWPPGKAFCIFFGKTPASRGNEPRAYSPVNVVGEVLDDIAMLQQVRTGTPVRIVAGE